MSHRAAGVHKIFVVQNLDFFIELSVKAHELVLFLICNKEKNIQTKAELTFFSSVNNTAYILKLLSWDLYVSLHTQNE